MVRPSDLGTTVPRTLNVEATVSEYLRSGAPAEEVALTITIVGARMVGGTAVRVCEPSDLTGGTQVEGVGNESSRRFTLGLGSELVGKAIMCTTVVAEIGEGGGGGGATIKRGFQNAAALGASADFTDTEPVTLAGGAATVHERYDF